MSKTSNNTLLQSALFCTLIFSGNAAATDSTDGFYRQLVLRDTVSSPEQTFVINANMRTETPHSPSQQNVHAPVFTSGRVKTAIQPYSENSDFFILMVGPE